MTKINVQLSGIGTQVKNIMPSIEETMCNERGTIPLSELMVSVNPVHPYVSLSICRAGDRDLGIELLEALIRSHVNTSTTTLSGELYYPVHCCPCQCWGHSTGPINYPAISYPNPSNGIVPAMLSSHSSASLAKRTYECICTRRGQFSAEWWCFAKNMCNYIKLIGCNSHSVHFYWPIKGNSLQCSSAGG